ncbi:alpha/beta-hydrolase [Coprinopsis marcescibilis]|uniref:Alpha/beta-hydrolase n=1 Tax=Coprinopsis marcescibilis TaxID=230819 RepID=A0A5C3L5M2_COPMA|nr:alpha/beta-hydrolase [Coprinopsis marcescibilis]
MQGRMISITNSGRFLSRTRLQSAKGLHRPTVQRIQSRPWTSNVQPIELDYIVHSPRTNNKDKAVVILHGFFGSKRNWNTISKALMERLQRPVYALDLRNHGTSPHAEPMTYEAMAADVWKFINGNNLSEVSLIGHSMGGKVAMSVALAAGHEQPPHTLNHLVVVDVSPIKGRISQQFIDYVNTLKKIEDLGLKTRKEASDYLAQVEPDPGVRAFLLTNLLPFDKNNSQAHFMVPLNTFQDSISNIGDFPYLPGERVWNGQTLFVKGSRSPYIKEEHLHTIARYFPNYQLEVMHTGHWVHAEKPKEFTDAVVNYVETFN